MVNNNRQNQHQSKIIRYLFILCIYNFIMAGLVYATQQVAMYYNFNFDTWNWITWWFFFGILILIGGLFVYLTPFFLECLDEILNRIIIWIMIKYSLNIEKLERKLEELKSND